MGTWYSFSCGNCDYGEVLSGGKDTGMEAVVQTMVCRKCEIVTDVLIGQYGKEGPTGDAAFDKPLGKCPKWRAKKHLVPWEEGMPCPKCGGHMPKGELCALWD